MFFYLTTLNLARFLNETAPQVEPPKEGQPSNAHVVQAVEAWKHSDFLCHNYVLNGLVDSLYNVYCTTTTAKESLKLHQRQDEGWICFGDFNEILYAFEKLGGRGCNTNEMVDFSHACNIGNMEDMDATGVKFTWSNGRQGCDNVKKKLDRGEQDILKEEIKELLTREEVMWKQRSRVQWLREGDKNTRYFHTRATSQNKRNSILRLKDEDGRWVDNEDGVCDLVSAYFSNLFSSSSPQHCDSVVEAIDQSLTGNDILSLEKHVTAEEVYDALMQMAPTKALGPDAFVSNRVITDNAIVAFEVMHWLKNKKDGKRGSLALKIDMGKAYDRVEWHFIRAVLEKFRFPTHFTNLIMACVSSVSYSFNINGQVAGRVTPARGLRQRDPLSPYLFIMCAEALSSMIRKSVTQGRIHGVKVCRGAPAISHLFFADDSIFFLRASSADVINLKNILVRYCRSSGQLINYEKSEVSFSANVEPHVRTHIIDPLEVREVIV
ncbi:ribonuclease H [Tanacetum coccineum]